MLLKIKEINNGGNTHKKRDCKKLELFIYFISIRLSSLKKF